MRRSPGSTLALWVLLSRRASPRFTSSSPMNMLLVRTGTEGLAAGTPLISEWSIAGLAALLLRASALRSGPHIYLCIYLAVKVRRPGAGERVCGLRACGSSCTSSIAPPLGVRFCGTLVDGPLTVAEAALQPHAQQPHAPARFRRRERPPRPGRVPRRVWQ